MRMRELEERTGVHREVIRIFLRHNLVPPPRKLGKTIAEYGDEHVRAINAVRRLQTESRLTLPQIRDMLSGSPPEQRVSANVFPHLEQLVAARVGIDGHRVSIQSLEDRYDHAAQDARDLAELGVIEAFSTPENELSLSIPDAELVSIWGEMRLAGFLEDLDFNPKMLDFYIDAAKFVAGWEAKIFLERTQGSVDEETAAGMIERALPLMLNFFGLLRRKEFIRHLATGQPPTEIGNDAEIMPGHRSSF